jgi:hypothetical protein
VVSVESEGFGSTLTLHLTAVAGSARAALLAGFVGRAVQATQKRDDVLPFSG